MKIKQSIIIKTFLIVAAFLSCSVMLLCGMEAFHYLDKYDLDTTSYTATSQFEQLYLKYAERTAVYVTYKENGFETDPGSIYSTSDLISILDGSASGNLRPSESVYTPSQESFEYYNRILNYDSKSFYYYVKNTTTGNYYYNPNFATLLSNELNTTDITDTDFEKYLDNISTFPAYLVINTQNDRYITNVNKSKYNIMNDKSISWIADFLTNMYPILQEYESIDFGMGIVTSQEDTFLGYVLDNKISSNETTPSEPESKPVEVNNYIVYTFVLDNNTGVKDEFSSLRMNYSTLRSNFELHLRNIIIAFVCFIISLIALCAFSGYKRGVNGIYLNTFDRLYTELGFGIICGAFVMIYFFLLYMNDGYPQEIYFKISLTFAFILAFITGIIGLTSFVKRIKAHTLIRHSFFYIVFDYIFIRNFRRLRHFSQTLPALFINRNAAFRLLFTLGLFGILQGIAFIISYQSPLLYVGLVVLLFGIFTASLIKAFADMNTLILGTRKIADGDLNAKIQLNALSEPSKTIAFDINRIGDGLSNAVDAKLKSERLKTELITNVSHDIKTPLTSIINYVDLLRKEQLDNEKANNYLKILAEKSWRLKTLIEDLVEASKASTGTLNLTLERLDIVELTKQALGEFDDRFSQNHLETILNISNEHIHILGDGRSTYRIIENLFSNVTKYALPNTRIYVDVTNNESNAVIQIKNISASQLGISGDELMERFVRGDLSRNSEGCGLGLSIAKSLTSLQNGNFEIILDGDLFKSIVTLPLYSIERSK